MTTDRRTTLALCMIVRDEEPMLPACLQHAWGLWDELIIVDTGSTDQTVSIAEAAGATVIEHVWDDDFAAARNIALCAVKSDWVLMLDADEHISEALKGEIRQTIEDDKIGAATVNIRNLLPHGLVRSGPVLRLFRSDPEVRYRFPIHEEIASALHPYLTRTDRRMVALTGAIEHSGYVRERAAGRGKKERDLRILDKCLAADRSDLYSHYKRLELARYWDDKSLWRQAAVEAEEALDQLPSTALDGCHFGGGLLTLIAHGRYAGQEALTFLEQRGGQVAPSAELVNAKGQLHEEAGRLDAARAAFDVCLQIPEVRNLQMATVRPLMGLCRIAMAEGDGVAALSYSDRALEHAGRDPEALLAAFTLRMASGTEAAQEFAEAQIERHGQNPELLHAWGQAAMACGHPEVAEQAFAALIDEVPSVQVTLHLAQTKVRLSKFDEAHKLLAPLVESVAEAGIGLLVCELCLDRDTNLQLDLDEGEADQLLREWIVTALLGADDDVLRNVIKRVPTIQHVFPWLPEALGLAA